MFDPNYIPSLIDVAIAMDAMFFVENGVIPQEEEKDLIKNYQIASSSLGIELRPRIVLERDIHLVGRRGKKPEEAGLSADTVLFLHANYVYSGIRAAANMKNLPFRIVLVYDNVNGSDWIGRMVEILGIEDILDQVLNPQRQICVYPKFKEGQGIDSMDNYFLELTTGVGRAYEYFERLNQIRNLHSCPFKRDA